MREFPPLCTEFARCTPPPYILSLIAVSRETPPLFCSCGEVNARSLQDNSKIRAFLLLLMSGGRSW
ncbi:hypothetical protein AZE01_13690 [Escherichia coli]|nr:hypothetical protein BHS89_17325 [Escherichia coli]ORT14747.1 hypothetical protein BGP71_17245 [Escherichia coli]ORT18711.1 hypothetical protein BGP70_16800 [Escherichia coli]OWX81352.1 hypothetical protein BIQ87_16745 [Escherichia coli]OWX82372.1 hypothetical protein BIQ86_17425 [Escherichia coli]